MDKALISKEYLEGLREKGEQIWNLMDKDSTMDLNLRAQVANLLGRIKASSFLEKSLEI